MCRNTDCGASNETLVPIQKWPERSFLKRYECCQGVIHESSVYTRTNGFRNRPLWSGKQSFRAILSTESCSGLRLTHLMCGSTRDVFCRSFQIHFVRRVTAFSEALSEEVKLWFGRSDVDRRSHRSTTIQRNVEMLPWRRRCGRDGERVRWIISRAPRSRSDARIHTASVPSTRSLIIPNGNKSRLITVWSDLIFSNTRCSVDIL